MATYIYTAVDGNSGKERQGSINADSEELAAVALKKRNLYPISIKSTGKAPKPKRPGQRRSWNVNLGPTAIRRKDLTVLTRQLAILTDAGLPLLRSLRTLENQSPNPTVKSVLHRTSELIEGGSTFSEALAQNPKSFDKLYLNMIRAGEASGAMVSILDRLAMFMEKAAGIAGKVKTAMIYPVAVLTIAMVITSGLMIFIVPNFTATFQDLMPDKPLPAATQLIIAISNLLRGHAYLIFAGIAAVFFAFKLIKRNSFGKYAIDYICYRMPLFGPIVAKTAITRFSQTLSTLIASGVPLLNALNIVKDTAGNELVARAIEKVRQAVKEGDGIAAPLGATGIFPSMVVSMLEVGEETGRMPEMLNKIADTYEREVDNAVKGLTSLIEPLMIVFLAVIVGGIVIAMFMPLMAVFDGGYI